jgi:hypothetical protein
MAWWITSWVDGGEFSAGKLTGPLLKRAEVGTLLLLVAIAVTFFYPRVAALVALGSSLLCAALYIFLVAPVPFAEAFGDPDSEFKIMYGPGVQWHTLPFAGLLSVAGAGYLFVRAFTNARPIESGKT